MSQWLNRTVLSGSSINQNGTNSHTISFTPATSGNFLVAIIAGSITSSTPSGWTLLTSAVDSTGLYVFTKTASSGESSFSTTHNGSNYPIRGVVYEYPAGTSAIGSNSATGQIRESTNTGPTVSGLTGTYTRMAARSWNMNFSTATATTAWTLPTAEDYDAYVSQVSSIDGVTLSIAYDDNSSGSSFICSSTMTTTNVGGGSGEGVSFALRIPAWRQRTVLSGSSVDENGTNSHTVSFTPATAGNFLVAIIGGAVTSSTPSGWTLLVSAVNLTGLYVFTKTASASESSFSTTHNSSNYMIKGVVYEFPAGTTAIGSNSETGEGNGGVEPDPTVTGLTGTYTRMGARTYPMTQTISTASIAWTSPSVEDYDSYTPKVTNDGIFLGIAYDDNSTGSSFNNSSNITAADTGGTGEGVAFALYVPASPLPALVATYKPATNFSDYSINPKTVSVTTQAGDLVVVCGAMENGIDDFQSLSGNSISFTKQQQGIVNSGNANIAIWTGTDATGGTNWTLTLTSTGLNNSRFGFVVYVFRAHGGVGASSSTNVDNSAPSLGLTTTQANSAIVVVNADWNAVDGSSRTWRTVNSITPTTANGLEKAYEYIASQYTAYSAYYNDAGTAASKTVGLSAPAGQKYNIAAVEVKAASSGGSSNTAVFYWLGGINSP